GVLRKNLRTTIRSPSGSVICGGAHGNKSLRHSSQSNMIVSFRRKTFKQERYSTCLSDLAFFDRWRPPYKFTMVAIAVMPSPACRERDPDADKRRFLVLR